MKLILICLYLIVFAKVSTYSSLIESTNSLELKSSDNMQSSNENKLTLRDLLQSVDASSVKKRITEGNLQCASLFRANGQDYKDCTLDKAPDGQIPHKEWCYIEKTPNMTKVWDFCKPDMNYDKIRATIQNTLNKLTLDTRQINEEINKLTPQMVSLLGSHVSLGKIQEDLTSRVNGFYEHTITTENAINQLKTLSSTWESDESNSVSYAKAIVKAEEEMKVLMKKAKDLKEKEMEEENKKSKFSKDEIKLESEMTKMEIAEWIQEKENSWNKDCTGLLNYEEENEGTGLIAKYYNNPTFTGSFVTKLTKNINFDFTGTTPAEDINGQNYSIMWDGYVQAPHTSTFYFSIETEGGAEIWLSGNRILSLRMFSSHQDSRNRADEVLNEIAKRIKDNSTNNKNKLTSVGINLSAGDKYIIRIKYYHSVHDFNDENIKKYIKLSWSSDAMEEETIEKQYLFPENILAPGKLSGISNEIGVMRKLNDNDLAFKDSKLFIIQDIPREYLGSPSLKLNSLYKSDSIKFKLNIPMIVYVAKPEHYPRAFDDDFENMNQFLTVLEMDEPSEKEKEKLTFEAKNSMLFRIYKKKFEAGYVEIKLNKSGLSSKGSPLILFFGVDSANNTPTACGGELLWVSQPNSPHFKECKTSSKYNDQWGCMNGINGKLIDGPGMWASNNEGVGAWMEITFKGLYEIHKITYRDRSNPGEMNKKLEFLFSNGKKFEYFHRQDYSEEVITLPSTMRTYWVKITIKEVYGTINNGGSFKFHGTKCSTQKEPEISKENNSKIKPLFIPGEGPMYNMGCLESVSNSKQLFNVDKTSGKCVVINCFDSCTDETSSKIYGTNNYSKDSAICRSAVHSKVLSNKGGKAYLCFGDKALNLKQSLSNGVQSKNKSSTEMSINFKPYKEKEWIKTKVGTKFDVYEPFGWKKAYVSGISNTLLKLVKYKIEEDQNSIERVTTLSKVNLTIAPCGVKIKGRDCKGSLSDEVKKINIRFAPKNYKSRGDFIVDNGLPFGTNNQAYGWSKQMGNNIRSFDIQRNLNWNNYDNIVESYVEFPPNKKSKYCGSSITACDSVSYTIKAGPGKFVVKLFTHIVGSISQVDFQVNGNEVAHNISIPKGERKIFETVVESINDNIEITTECSDNCFYSMSRLNMIQIFQYSEEIPRDEPDRIAEGDICENRIKRGKDCESGESDVLYCVFQNSNSLGAAKCSGNYTKIKLPTPYKCPEAAGLDYCIKKVFISEKECNNYCPGLCDKKGICLGNGKQ